ncbi:hypothetical protein [Janthinobacterium sp. DSP2-3-3]|uniref:hypothetical protein n=1 Tax=unclassified Janthinobacterium TaxID=2610881 RepID=UPI003CED1E9A
MMRFFKTWLILILMTLLSLQAAAAGMRMSCAHGAQGVAHKVPARAIAQSCHQVQATPDMAGADSAPGERHAVCGVCSAFCMGALVPPSIAPALPACSGAESVTMTTTPLPAGFVPDGPRRPPRHA